jgi:hypothetical protein
MRRRDLFLLFGSAAALQAQKYAGPRPPKPDHPYLLHADDLVPTEVLMAKEEAKKDDIIYSVDGATSPAKTPLASPIFLMQADKIQPERLGCYKWDVRNGRREIVFSKKKGRSGKPLLLSVNRLTTDNLYRIEVVPSLEDGEYSLSPEGVNQVFCFRVF